MEKFKEEDKELVTSKIANLYNNQCNFLSIFEESKKFYKKLHMSGLVREFDRFKRTTIGNYLYMTAAGCTYKNLIKKINEDFTSKEDFIKACDEASRDLNILIKSATIKKDAYNHAIVSDLEDKMIEEAKRLRDYNTKYGENDEMSYMLGEGLMIFTQSVEEYDVVKCEEALDKIKSINNEISKSVEVETEEEFDDLGSNEEEFDDLGSDTEKNEEEFDDLVSNNETDKEEETNDLGSKEEEITSDINKEVKDYTYSVGYEPDTLYNDDYMNPYTYAIDRKVTYIKNKEVTFDDKVYTVDESLDNKSKLLTAISNLETALDGYNYYSSVVEDIKNVYLLIRAGVLPKVDNVTETINNYANVVNKENKKQFNKFHGKSVNVDRDKEQQFINTHLGTNKRDIKKDIISKYERLLDVYNTTGNYKNLVDKYSTCYDMNPYKYSNYELNIIIMDLDSVYISKTKSK